MKSFFPQFLLSSLAAFPSAPGSPFAREDAAFGVMSSAGWVQDVPKQEPPALPPISKPKDGARTGEPATQVLVPGVLPAGTDPKAQEAWERTTRGRLAGSSTGAAPRVLAFDLAIEVRHRSAENQTNDSPRPWRYRFQSPGFVRVTTVNQRELLRGPQGDFLIDPDRHEKIQLGASRENAEDLRQLNESIGIAQNFIALTDPSALRIARLSLMAAAPSGLPPKLQKRLGEMQLQWLELLTPDFHLIPAPAGSPAPAANLVRVLIGADQKSGEVEVAVVDANSDAAVLSAAAVLIELASYAPIDGFRMPQQIKVYDVDTKSSPRAFGWEPTTSLGVLTQSASLRPAFKPEDFLPPQH